MTSSKTCGRHFLANTWYVIAWEVSRSNGRRRERPDDEWLRHSSDGEGMATATEKGKHKFQWRRERDSNPRYRCWQYTRFPVALLRPARTSLRCSGINKPVFMSLKPMGNGGEGAIRTLFRRQKHIVNSISCMPPNFKIVRQSPNCCQTLVAG